MSGTDGLIASRLKHRFDGFDVDENYLRLIQMSPHNTITYELQLLASRPRGV